MATKPVNKVMPKPLEGLGKKETPISDEEKTVLNKLGRDIKAARFEVHLKEPGWVIYTKGDSTIDSDTRYGRIEIRRWNGKLAKSYGDGYFASFTLYRKSGRGDRRTNEKVYSETRELIKPKNVGKLPQMFDRYMAAVKKELGR